MNRNSVSYPGDTIIIIVANHILSQTTKPELAQYFHAIIFSPKIRRLIKAIKTGFLKTWSGLTEELINKHL